MKHQFQKVLCFICLLLPNLASAAFLGGGSDMGNGGDFIQCRHSESNELNGLYSLDYILTYRSDKPLRSPKSYENSLDKVEELLLDNVPTMAKQFSEFKNTVFSEDESGMRVWRPVEFGLIDLTDEDIPSVNAIPENCKQGNKVSLIQAAIRLNPRKSTVVGKIFYHYMPEAIEMAKQRPLQLSMLLVHEWLWDVSGNVEVNRRVNRFLHSEEILSMSVDEVRKRLMDLGLTIPPRDAELFSTRWCQTSEEKVEMFPATDLSEHSGHYKVLYREKECDKDMNCNEGFIGTWRPSFVGRVVKDGVFSHSREEKLISLHPYVGSGRDSKKLGCEYNELGSLRCAPLFDEQYYPHAPRVFGSVSDTCFWIYQSMVSNQVPRWSKAAFIQYEIVVYSDRIWKQ